MRFINRTTELARLDAVLGGGLAVLYGRRRIGKTRLLVEWAKKRKGVYFVADQSTPEIQRRYFAEALAAVLPGFADVEYRDWRALFDRIASDAARAGFRGPLIVDELPYLVTGSPELPSVLQRWVDHDIKDGGLAFALAGSSQRMMQRLVFDRQAPLFGRADQLFELMPLAPRHIREVFPARSARQVIELFAAWGGVPRYWELAREAGRDALDQLARLVLDPAGPLHLEPDRLLLEEMPPALEMRPLLDAIGGGAHRVSEIAGRLGRPATSLSRPLERLVATGIIRREVPFGEAARKSRRSLYSIADPFMRLWFRVVAPHRSQLAAGTDASRGKILRGHWQALIASAWEDLCRSAVVDVRAASALGQRGPWGPAGRWWRRTAPEWDVVATAIDGRRLLLGEVKLGERPVSGRAAAGMARELAAREPPELPAKLARHEVVRALFVPALAKGAATRYGDVVLVTAADLGLTGGRT